MSPWPPSQPCRGKGKTDAEGHESDGRYQQHDHATADGALSLFCGAGCVAVAHGATLAEGRSRPEKEKQHECGQTELHLTPRCRIRNASGKKMHISLHLRGLRRKTPFKTCRDPVLTE